LVAPSIILFRGMKRPELHVSSLAMYQALQGTIQALPNLQQLNLIDDDDFT